MRLYSFIGLLILSLILVGFELLSLWVSLDDFSRGGGRGCGLNLGEFHVLHFLLTSVFCWGLVDLVTL